MPTPSFVYGTDEPGKPLSTIYAEHNAQYGKVLSGLSDAGPMSLLSPVSAPTSAPTITLSAGSLNGSYQWGTYWITGIADGTGNYNVTGRTIPSPYSAAQNLVNQQGTVSITGEAIPTGVVGWGVVRNHAGGAAWYEVPGSEQFENGSGSMPTTYVDNTADANLVTAAPAANTTGTSLSGSINASELGGNPPGYYLPATATAANSANLGGNSPNYYLPADAEAVSAAELADYNGGHSIKATWTGSAIQFDVDATANEPVQNALQVGGLDPVSAAMLYG